MRSSFLVVGTLSLVILSGCSNPLRPQPVNAPTMATSTTSATSSVIVVVPTSTPAVEENPSIQRTTSSTTILLKDETGLPLTIQTLDKTQKFQPIGSCHVTDDTVEIQPTPLLDEAKRARLNTMLNQAFLTLDRGTSTERVVTFDEFVDHTLKDCAATLQELNGEPTDYPSMSDYAYSNSIEVTKNDHGFVSFHISGYEYTGGAHPNSWSTFLTIDTQQEKVLTLGDILKQDQLKPFMQKEHRALIKEYADSLFDERLQEFRTFVAQPAKTASSTEITSLAAFDEFYLTDANIVTEYSPYEIGPYAAGFLTTQFPLTEIRSMIRPELVDRLLPNK